MSDHEEQLSPYNSDDERAVESAAVSSKPAALVPHVPPSQSVALTKTLKALVIMKQPESSSGQSEVFGTQYSPDGTLVANSCGDASIRVYRVNDAKELYHLKTDDSLPMTSLRYRPTMAGSTTRNVLISGNASGQIHHWHVTSSKTFHAIKEQDNQVFCLDYSADGSRFASGGQDHAIRIYDEATKSLTHEMRGGYGRELTGHSNRIFAIKFAAHDPNLLLSGGWDQSILLWDLRAEKPVRSMFGPSICGDSLDVNSKYVLTGSYRMDKQLQLWDLGSGEVVCDFHWPTENPVMLYAAKFSKHVRARSLRPAALPSCHCILLSLCLIMIFPLTLCLQDQGRHIVAGGSSAGAHTVHEARIFETSGPKCAIARVANMKVGVFSVDTHPAMRQAAIASGDGTIQIVEY
jgi:COMPASS component SWD3